MFLTSRSDHLPLSLTTRLEGLWPLRTRPDDSGLSPMVFCVTHQIGAVELIGSVPEAHPEVGLFLAVNRASEDRLG